MTGHMIDVFLTFKELPNNFSKWLCNITFPPAVHENSSSSTGLPTIGVCSLYNFSYLRGYVMANSHGLNLCFLITNDRSTFFNWYHFPSV